MPSKLAQLAEDNPLGGTRLSAALQASYGDQIKIESARNDDERDLLADTKAIFEQIDQAGGVEPATLINMHPWEIRSTGPHLEGIVVPACPIGQPFLQYVHRDLRIDRADKGGRFAITPVWPIMLMRDVVRQHEQWGGLVAYMGETRLGENRKASSADIIAALLRDEQNEEKRQMLMKLKAQAKDSRYATAGDIKEMMSSAEERQITYYRKRCSQVSGAYASDSKTAFRQITPADRLMARWLHQRGIFANLPQWVVEERPDDYKPMTCVKCGKDVETIKVDGILKPKGFACKECGYILDGIRAYEAGEISDEHVSLKRHTRGELDAAGLKHVNTLAEDRAAKEKAKAKAGKAKENEQA